MGKIFTIYKRRLNRKNYFFGNFLLLIFIYGFIWLGGILRYTNADPFMLLLFMLFFVVFLLALYFTFALTIARLHDFGRSGRYTFLTLVPYVNFLFFIVLLFVPGDKSKNKYGPAQK